jgi:hypothetical protein
VRTGSRGSAGRLGRRAAAAGPPAPSARRGARSPRPRSGPGRHSGDRQGPRSRTRGARGSRRTTNSAAGGAQDPPPERHPGRNEGIRTRARGLAPGGRQGRDAGASARQRGPQTANSRKDSYGWGCRPKLTGEALVASGPRKRSGTSGYPDPSRGPDRSTTGQVSMKGNGSGRRLWNCLVGRHHGDMEIYGRGMIRADRSTTCAHRMEFAQKIPL